MDILYIDDDPEDQDIFKEAVNSIDISYSCTVANDGREGLKLLQEILVMPDYIFVDVNMPGMTGKQFLLEIKKIPRLRSIPVIMYSTTSRQAERHQFIELGAYKFCVKPNTFTGICELIASVIREPQPLINKP